MLSSRQHDALDELHWNMQLKGGRVQTLSIVILTLSTLFPALDLAGFREGPGWFSLPVCLLIAAVGGSVAGAIFYPGFRFWYVGMLCGGIIGVSCLLATFLYVLPRQEIYSFEVMFPIILGALPGFLLYYILMRCLVLARAAAVDRADAADEEDWTVRHRRRRPTSP